MIEGAGNIGVEFGRGGVALADNVRASRLFKITAGANPYAASEVVLDESDGSKAATGVYDVTATTKELWEVNGNASVPADTIVEATPNPAGGGFYFSYPAAVAAAATYVQTTLTSDTTLSASSGTYTDIVSLTIATAGTYLVSVTMSGRLSTNTQFDLLIGKFLKNGSDISSTFMYFCRMHTAGDDSIETVSHTLVIPSLAVSDVVKVAVTAQFGGTVGNKTIYGGTSRGTRLVAARLGT